MPRFEFKSENVKKNLYDFPKLKLTKNEIARVVLLEDPIGEYTHNLRKPKLVNGVPVTITKTRKDNTTYEDYNYDFVSNVICLGDFATLEANGSDPKNCPACAEAARSDRVGAPKRRFALHLIRYATKANSSDVATPFQVQTVVYSFTDKVFSKLFGIKEEWGDLRQRDLILKCENADFQNYEFTVASKAAWLEDDDRKKLTSEVFKNNRAEQLDVFVGTRKERQYVEMDLAQVNEAYNIAEGVVQQSSADAALNSVGSLTDGLDDLLGGGSSSDTAEAAAEPEAVGSFDDLLGDDASAETAEAAAEPEEEDSLAASVGGSDAGVEAALDDLLKDL